MNEVTIHRHKDGSLAIAEAPELFICSRESLQMIIDSQNQAVGQLADLRLKYSDHHAEAERLTADNAELHRRNSVLTLHRNAAKAEIERLDAELAKASGLQQTVSIARQTIQDQSTAIDRNARVIEQLGHQLIEAREQAANADKRTSEAKRQRDAENQASDATRLAYETLQHDVRALLVETEQEQSRHFDDRHIAFTRRKIAFFHKHQELLKPRHSHDVAPGPTAAPEDGKPQPCPQCGNPMDPRPLPSGRRTQWSCPCGGLILAETKQAQPEPDNELPVCPACHRMPCHCAAGPIRSTHPSSHPGWIHDRQREQDDADESIKRGIGGGPGY